MSYKVPRYALPQVSTPIDDNDVANKAYVDASGGGGLVHAVVVKPTTTSRANTTVLEDDPDIKFTAAINKLYLVQLFLIMKSGAAGDLKYGWKLPSGATIKYIPADWGTQTNSIPATTNPKLQSGNNDERMQTTWYLITVGGTGGEIPMEWAQQVSDAGTTEIRAGTTMIVYES